LNISEEQVRDIASLANLTLTETEVARMQKELSEILTHVEKLNEVDTTGVEPMAQVLFESDETATLRDDVEKPSLTNEEAVANAPVSSGGYYKVPLVIER
jgi:aspartyl-tRNA(Asn)/glutamyl-tRNA(Gln) amidotransferase subunit C